MVYPQTCYCTSTCLAATAGSIRKTLEKLATLHRVVFQVEFSLLLAFLGPLEGSAVEKVRGMSLQYPTTQEAVHICNGAVSEKSPENFNFRPPLPAEYVTVFSGQTDAPEVRCDLTDRQTHRTTTVQRFKGLCTETHRGMANTSKTHTNTHYYRFFIVEDSWLSVTHTRRATLPTMITNSIVVQVTYVRLAFVGNTRQRGYPSHRDTTST